MVGSKPVTRYAPFVRLNSSNTAFAAVFGRLEERSRRSQVSQAPMRMLSSERISVCRSSPEEMWITRPVDIKSYKPKRPNQVESRALDGFILQEAQKVQKVLALATWNL